jgi:hypothetical protein
MHCGGIGNVRTFDGKNDMRLDWTPDERIGLNCRPMQLKQRYGRVRGAWLRHMRGSPAAGLMEWKPRRIWEARSAARAPAMQREQWRRRREVSHPVTRFDLQILRDPCRWVTRLRLYRATRREPSARPNASSEQRSGLYRVSSLHRKSGSAKKPERFLAYRKRRPKIAPAGKIPLPTKRPLCEAWQVRALDGWFQIFRPIYPVLPVTSPTQPPGSHRPYVILTPGKARITDGFVFISESS